MIWVAWRQQRLSILTIAGIVLLLVATLVYVRMDVTSLLPDKDLVSDKYRVFMNGFSVVMIALPPLAGMFTGAPLFAREIEQGTHIFGLTQSVSRRRWLATKLVLAGGSLVVSMFILGLVAAWALDPVNFVTMSSKLSSPLFEIQGLTVGVYSLLAFTIGTIAGLLLRNTLAAMVVTLVAYAVLVTGAIAVRPYYAEPTRIEATFASGQWNVPALDQWTMATGHLDANGKEVVDTSALAECRSVGCLRERGIVAAFTDVHLPGQFWRFQLTDLGLFLLLSAGVFGVGMPLVRRRLT